MSWALVIHDSPEMLAMIAGTVATIQGTPVEAVSNLKQARLALMKRHADACSLVVASASAPLSELEAQRLDSIAPVLAEFLAEFRSCNAVSPGLVLPSALDSGLSAVESVAGVRFVAFDRLASTLEELKRAKAGPHAMLPRHADVDISLIGPVGQWTIKGTGGQKETGYINLNNTELLRQLKSDSARVSSADSEQLGRLGKQMYECLLPYPCRLEEQLAHFTPPGSSFEGVRFRFEVDQAHSRLMVEAMARPRDPTSADALDFYMLQAPIYRKFGTAEARYPLFKDQQSRSTRIDCLVIQGKVERFIAAPPVAETFRPIPHAAAEADMLESYMVSNRDAFRLGEVKVLRPAAALASGYAETVRSALSERDWHLVHYAGHSTQGSDGIAYLVLGNGEGELIAVDDFARRVSQAQFVFLSSCRSADATFVMKLVERNIPAVAGYAFPINDQVAYDFAQEFYRNLFAGALSTRFLEYAFMHARTYLHRQNRDKPIWTAPILFMQKADGQRDEARATATGVQV